MRFTETELQLVAKVQTLSATRKKIQKKVDTRKASLDKSVAVVKRTSEVLARESNLLYDIEVGLDRLRKELLESLKQGEDSILPPIKTNIVLSHYELGRED